MSDNGGLNMYKNMHFGANSGLNIAFKHCMFLKKSMKLHLSYNYIKTILKACISQETCGILMFIFRAVFENMHDKQV